MRSPTRADLENAAKILFTELAAEIDRPREFDREYFDEDVNWNIECSRERVSALDRQLVEGVFDEAVKLRAIRMMDGLDVTGEPGTGNEHHFARQLAARAEREQLQLFIHLLESPQLPYRNEDTLFSVLPEGPLSRPAVEAPSRTERPRLTVREAVSDYLRRQSARKLGNSQIEELSRALMWLREVTGDLMPLESVDTATLRNFRDDIVRLDVSLRGRSGPFRDRLTNVADRQVKSVTALRYWRSVQGFFAWCLAEQHLANDPAAGLKIDMKRGESARTPPPFTQDELRALFATPLYAGYQTPKRAKNVGPCHRREGHWWSGVLLLMTGLRAGELAQLLPSDFVFDDPVPHLKIRQTDDAGKQIKSTKNLASVRDVPLAPVLHVLGLKQFVATRASIGPRSRVFREFRLGSKGRTSDGLTKFWSSYLRDFGLWKAGRSTHVFRHTVIACLRANDVALEDIAALVGHSGRTVTQGYGGAYPLSRKARTLDKLDYGFDLVAALGGPYEEKIHGSEY